MVFWHPNGWTVYQVLEDYIRDRLERAGYQEVRTPQLVDRLWLASGHWDKYQENMFVTSSESRDYAVGHELSVSCADLQQKDHIIPSCNSS